MTNEQQINTSFVKDDNEATVVCPDCDLAKTVSVKQFRNQQHKIKVKCTCGNVFEIMLEFRQHRRKDTSLSGTYKSDASNIDDGVVEIVNLSMGGACFETRGNHDVKIGQTGSINFTLDNRKQSVLLKYVVIRSAQGNRIGCEFIEDQAYEAALGFYLQP